jgi:hypothetical protein
MTTTRTSKASIQSDGDALKSQTRDRGVEGLVVYPNQPEQDQSGLLAP